LLKESVGSQDQIASAYGGFNHIKFKNNNSFLVKKINITEKRKKLLNNNLLLFFTGVSRTSEKIVKSMLKNYNNKKSNLYSIQQKVKIAKEILESNSNIDDFGLLLNEAWNEKKQLSHNISNSSIDEIYEIAKKNGALGGKILGAGGGGFILFFANPKYHKKIINSLKFLIHVPFNFDNEGSSIIFNDKPNVFESKRRNYKFSEFKGY
jgi:D-glycero-alpha-D-manno-heptose-7-phosphate kinase